MDRFEAMGILIGIVDEGSLSAASRALHVPLPTLSRKLADLETRLGARLLVRTTRRLTLTDAGATYVEAARRILEDVAEAEREAAGEFGEPRGELVVTAPSMFGRLHVLPLVEQFLAQHPAIRVRLALGDRNLHLIEDRVDLAVRIGELPDSGLVATHIGAMQAVVCASPAFLAERGEPGTPNDLKTTPCIGVDLPGPLLDWRLSPALNITPRLVVSSPEAAAEAAGRGAGVARLLYYQVAAAVEAGRLRLILRAYEAAPAPVHLVHVSRQRMPLKLRRFLDFATPRLRAALARLTPTPEPSAPL